MDSILSMIFSTDFFYFAIRMSTPIVFATLAVLVSNKAGVVNIGVEGAMLLAALMGVVGSAQFQNVWAGLLTAVLSGIFVSMLLAFFHLVMGTDTILTGIAINMMASGLTIFILFILTGDKGVSTGLASKTIPNIEIPLIKDIPFLGPVVSGQNLLTYLALISIILLVFFLKKTKTGLYIRATGENDEAVITAGISANRIKVYALILCGVFAGLGGAFMSMAYVSMFTKDMVAGRGFIALAAEAMGMGNPWLSSISAILFGFADALSNNLQLFNVPSEITRMIPYILTVVALAVYAYREKKKAARENIE